MNGWAGKVVFVSLELDRPSKFQHNDKGSVICWLRHRIKPWCHRIKPYQLCYKPTQCSSGSQCFYLSTEAIGLSGKRLSSCNLDDLVIQWHQYAPCLCWPWSPCHNSVWKIFLQVDLLQRIHMMVKSTATPSVYSEQSFDIPQCIYS